MSKLIRKPTCWVLIAFVASRIFYVALGIRFNANDLDILWQLPDRQWLLSRLWETLFYTHSQPPLFAFLVGLVLKLNPTRPELLFALLYLGFGLLLTITMFQTLKLLVPDTIAAVATIFFVISPATVIYENWLFYTYLIAALLMSGFWFLFRFANGGAFLDGFLFFLSISSVALMRSSFHLIWIAALVPLALRFSSMQRWSLKLAVATPCFLVLALYLKNYIVFGTFNSSSWVGLSFHRMVTTSLNNQQRKDMIASKRLFFDTLEPEDGFLSLNAYGVQYTDRPQFDDIPALAEPSKPTLGNINLNHYAYIEFSNKRMADALTILQSCPSCYAYTVLQAFVIFSRTATNYLMFENTNNYEVTAPIRQFFDEIIYGKVTVQVDTINKREVTIYPRMMLLIPAVILLSIRLAIRAFRVGSRLALPLAAMIGTVVFASATYILLDIGENNRFRFELDPLLFCLGIYVCWTFYKDVSNALKRGRGKDRITS
jgi:hypothetical protein